jgi:hypothetical protein
MTDDVSKLPAWPPSGVTIDAMAFFMAERDAYRARMEALVAECIELLEHAEDTLSNADRRRIDALLAACEREEGR